MARHDRDLGMDRPITRRDLVHGASLFAAGLGLHGRGMALGSENQGDPVYPPTLTGLRGSQPGSFEVAHALAREGKAFPSAADIGEHYDLVVVGAGISGLASAYYYRQRHGAGARILLLDNHDDFGGHARRNEFHQGGEMRLALGGTHNLEHWQFSATVKALMEELGVDVQDMRRSMEFGYGRDGERGSAIWFDKETYGENRLVTGYTLENWAAGDSLACIDQMPLNGEARAQLKALFAPGQQLFSGRSEVELQAYLASISYPDFLRKHGGLNEEALQLFQTAMHGSWGIELRAASAREALEDGMPGLALLGVAPGPDDFDYPVAMFPDGNASLARLLVQRLIPSVAPGTDAGNVALASFDYRQLDRPQNPVRLRLNATVIHATNSGRGVSVAYVQGDQVRRITARHAVMACYHVILPHLCPELPAAQKAAQKHQVKIPLLQTNVLLRSSKALDRLGINGAICPGRMHRSMFLSRGINTAGYQHAVADQGPVPLTFFGSLSPPASAVTIHDQLRASRARMLQLDFEDYEREVRSVLDGMLGPAGFDVQRDVLAVTVNRWPHGYAYEYMDLWDEPYPAGQAPHEIARRPFGNISIANSDAGASAYTHVAIDQAWRAVQELPA